MTTTKRTPMRGEPPWKGPLIRKADALAITSLRARMETLAKELKLVKADLDARERHLIAQLKADTPIEPGAPRMAIVMETGKRSVAWREEYEKLQGKAAAEALLAATEPPTHERLVIEA